MKRLGLGIALGLITAAGIASACFFEHFSSVHFHSGKPDFGLLPRRGILRWKESDTRPSNTDAEGGISTHAELKSEEFYGWKDAHDANRAILLQRMFVSANKGHWSAARLQIRTLAQRFEWTGELRDLDTVLGRVLALSTKQRTALKPAMKVYLDAIEHKLGTKLGLSVEGFGKLTALKQAGFLHEHARYQLLTSHSLAPEIRNGCQKFLAEFPDSPKREDALIMIARNAILPALPKDRSIGEGKKAMAQLQKEFPHSRFLKELPGLCARLLYLDKQYHAALSAYFRIAALDSARIVIADMPKSEQGDANVRLLAANLKAMNAAKRYEPYETAIREVNRLRQIATVSQARQLSNLLKRDPELASDYLYYRLYHTHTKLKELKQLARFAEEVAARHPNMQFSPDVMTRFAESAYREGMYSRALVWANRSLQVQTTDRALYVRGASRHKRRQISGATHDFETILKRFPNSPLIPTARENLALLYEAVGRFDKALETFFALSGPIHDLKSDEYDENRYIGYHNDIAYLLDARMTTSQVAAYVRSYPRHRERKLLLYSLGIRYLRDERWNEAERQFRLLPLKVYAKFSEGRKQWAEKPSPEPLAVIRDLRLRQRKIAAAQNANQRAKAIYEYASYYSTHGTLLLYNSALWNDTRNTSFDFYWNEAVATKRDVRVVRRYMYEHEAFARSRALCKQIARQYPKAPIMPYVLYRQAAATRRLASFNQWWNKETGRAKLWDDSIRTMRRIVRNYPNHPVAVHARKYADVFEKERKELVWQRDSKSVEQSKETIVKAKEIALQHDRF